MSQQAHFYASLIQKQIENLIPDGTMVAEKKLLDSVEKGMASLKRCFPHIKDKYFDGGFDASFNHLHGDHYAMFLYRVSRYAYTDSNDETLATKLFLLNKMLFGCDIFYQVELPEIFLLVHPLGTVLGHAQYEEYFCAYQGVIVGSKLDEKYPVFSKNTIMYANSSVIGDCKVGENVVFGAASQVINQDIPSDHMVFGYHPDTKFKPYKKEESLSVFHI